MIKTLTDKQLITRASEDMNALRARALKIGDKELVLAVKHVDTLVDLLLSRVLEVK